jgi:hypothetical protein
MYHISQGGFNALQKAAEKGHLEIVTLWINNGCCCDMNITAKVSHTYVL